MLRPHPQQILILAPHPDDAELGCGATIAKLADAGVSITILMLSDRGEQAWMREAVEAARILSPEREITVETLHHTVFHMAEQRQAILRALEAYRDKLNPDAVFAPAAWDLHQDHVCAMAEARRVFRDTTLLGYEILRSARRFRPMVFIPVTRDQVDRKRRAAACYVTQRHKLYCKRAAIDGLATARGAMCNQPLAEAFEIEWMVWEQVT